jgi:hypothetical protein
MKAQRRWQIATVIGGAACVLELWLAIITEGDPLMRVLASLAAFFIGMQAIASWRKGWPRNG